LIYAGKFQTQTGGFEVTEDVLQGWANTHRRMREKGVDIPLPLRHTEDPEANRGSVLDMLVETDSKGRRGLFGKIQFRDKEAAELAKTAQVSIYSPVKFTDGTGTEYARPIRHVALTDYPVIPDLDKWAPIAASFATLLDKELKMPLKELATTLKLSFEENTDEDKLQEVIVAAFAEKEGALKAKDDEIKALMQRLPKDPVKVLPSHRGMLRDNRNIKLEKLVLEARITPAVQKELEGVFCTDASLDLVLSNESVVDYFEQVLAALAKNEPLELGEAATVVLSKEGLNGREENVLVKNMEARVAALK